ncbi:TPA: DUF1642 domain-containing protein [Streptococcus suis]|uniref:DUF1642 domain-containing protein n=1 Tax=Streptococcus suis TaxID=1307 RepID=UPI0009424090|nr:DUF1642 domain-containing protein [Streptococcus suis]NQN94007.1 DUF1642 domain-containing protein [Streptococcus suis]NQO06194.1 DUF1642 domain-containing protein [Streptococcus suis]NQO36637.1 DUF1642 domain-containing protein [Streptococcus suis]NQO74761.1 DUF1642 domain-containing protein [Streptococcus suis]NQP40315.1 DUF1642 domain-containing protein [Streptococcus suis]
MNKQEAKQKLHNIAFAKMNARPDDLKLADVMQVIDQIDEPQKVVVPKHIADKIEYCKDTEGYGLFHAMDYCYNYKDSAEWLEYNQETFARAWLDGYEIEQEKLYTVEIPNPNNTSANVFCLRKDGGKVHISKQNYKTYKQSRYCQLTESEIKKDFEWAWQWAKEVE